MGVPLTHPFSYRILILSQPAIGDPPWLSATLSAKLGTWRVSSIPKLGMKSWTGIWSHALIQLQAVLRCARGGHDLVVCHTWEEIVRLLFINSGLAWLRFKEKQMIQRYWNGYVWYEHPWTSKHGIIQRLIRQWRAVGCVFLPRPPYS